MWLLPYFFNFKNYGRNDKRNKYLHILNSNFLSIFCYTLNQLCAPLKKNQAVKIENRMPTYTVDYVFHSRLIGDREKVREDPFRVQFYSYI